MAVGRTAVTSTDNINELSVTFFQNSSSAGSATYGVGNQLLFQNTSTVASATIGNSGAVDFADTSTAGRSPKAMLERGVVRYAW